MYLQFTAQQETENYHVFPSNIPVFLFIYNEKRKFYINFKYKTYFYEQKKFNKMLLYMFEILNTAKFKDEIWIFQIDTYYIHFGLTY